MNNTTSSWIGENIRVLEKFRIFLKTLTTIFLLLSVVMIITMIFTADEVYESDMDNGEAHGQWEDREVVDLDEEDEEDSENSGGIEDEDELEEAEDEELKILGSDGGDDTDYGTDSSI